MNTFTELPTTSAAPSGTVGADVGRPYMIRGGQVMAHSGACICPTCKQVHHRTERWIEWPDGRTKRLKAYDVCGCTANSSITRITIGDTGMTLEAATWFRSGWMRAARHPKDYQEYGTFAWERLFMRVRTALAVEAKMMKEMQP
jgi:hypothetical protein